MIELLEKPCFILLVSEKGGVHSCHGQTRPDGCPAYGEYGVDEWENCAYGKNCTRYKSYIDIQTDRLRNYFAAEAMSSIVRKINTQLITDDSLRDSFVRIILEVIPKDSFKIADSMIQTKFKDMEERGEKEKARRLELED